MKTYLKLTIHTVAALLVSSSLVLAQQPTAQERVVALKASLAASQAILKSYEWVETSVISVKGEEKSRKQERCYYGADGKIQKVLLSQSAPPPKKRGLRGKIAAAKTEELTDYMKEAVALVKVYMPPEPVLIEKAKNAGKVSLSPQAGQRVRLNFADYLKAGDNLALDVDLANNRPTSAKVTTYLDSPSEPVTLNVYFSVLNGAATYPGTVSLNAPGKSLNVSVVNSGYRRMGY